MRFIDRLEVRQLFARLPLCPQALALAFRVLIDDLTGASRMLLVER
jgi:hypothetical protein